MSTEPNYAREGVRMMPSRIHPDSRACFLEIAREGKSLAISLDLWVAPKRQVQVAVAETRPNSSTRGQENIMFGSEVRTRRILMPSAVGDGYKVFEPRPTALISATSRVYNHGNEHGRLCNNIEIANDWETQHK